MLADCCAVGRCWSQHLPSVPYSLALEVRVFSMGLTTPVLQMCSGEWRNSVLGQSPSAIAGDRREGQACSWGWSTLRLPWISETLHYLTGFFFVTVIWNKVCVTAQQKVSSSEQMELKIIIKNFHPCSSLSWHCSQTRFTLWAYFKNLVLSYLKCQPIWSFYQLDNLIWHSGEKIWCIVRLSSTFTSWTKNNPVILISFSSFKKITVGFCFVFFFLVSIIFLKNNS